MMDTVGGAELTTASGWLGSNVGLSGKLAASCAWRTSSSQTPLAPGDLTNLERSISGFSARPAGYFYDSGFTDMNKRALFWTSTQGTDARNYAVGRLLDYNQAGVNTASGRKYTGRSVRCVRDK